MLKVDKLSFKYGSNVILRDISFEIPLGHCMAVLGNNGAGKSTMVKCLNRILTPVSGSITLCDKDLRKLPRNAVAKEVAYVAQVSETSRFTVFDTVMLGRKPYIKFSPSPEDYKIVEDVLEKMNISDLSLRYINQLSGGQLQKVMLARALAQQPKVLLLDEPTSSLDLKSQHSMLSLVADIAKRENICAIIVIHDLNLALRYCDRFLFLKDSSVFSHGDVNSVNTDTINDVYGMNVAIENVRGFRTVVPLCS